MNLKSFNDTIIWLVCFASLLLLLSAVMNSEEVASNTLIGCFLLLGSSLCVIFLRNRFDGVVVCAIAGTLLALGGYLTNAFNSRGTIVAVTIMMLPLTVRLFTGRKIYRI